MHRYVCLFDFVSSKRKSNLLNVDLTEKEQLTLSTNEEFLTGKRNENVLVTCSAINPNKLVWTHRRTNNDESSAVSKEKTIELIKNSRTVSLKLEGLRKDDEGYYTCSLKYNPNVNKTFHLEIKGKFVMKD
jgi:hypothetical protein